MASLLDTIMLDHFAYRETHDTALTRCFIGPPGSGKSTAPMQAAALLGVPCYTISLLATDPMEVRGYDTPGADGELVARVASHWKDREPYSIVVFEELDKAYLPQLHAVIDLMTGRKVGTFELPPLHFIAVANSAEFASPAVLDRLLLTPVPDPRKTARERRKLEKRIIEYSGLHPHMDQRSEMDELLDKEVLPPYNVLDSLGTGKRTAPPKSGTSERRVIASIKGRDMSNRYIKALVQANNSLCESFEEYEHYMVFDRTSAQAADHISWSKLLQREDLTPVQEQTIRVNSHMTAYLLNKPEGEDEEDDA